MLTLIARAAALSLLLAFAAQPARAADDAPVSAGAITVKRAWLRATPNGAKVAGGYVTLVNAGPSEDRLTGASLDIAAKGEVHTMSMSGGVMHMARLDGGLAVASGATVTLEPGGNHLMFLDPTAPLKEGQHVSGTLTFAKAGTVKVTFVVAGLAAKSAPMIGGMSDHGAMSR